MKGVELLQQETWIDNLLFCFLPTTLYSFSLCLLSKIWFETYKQVSDVAHVSDCILWPLLVMTIFLNPSVVYVNLQNSSHKQEHSEANKKQIHFPENTGHIGTSKCCNSFFIHFVLERVCLKSDLTIQLWNGILITSQHYIYLMMTIILNLVHWSAPNKFKGKHNFVFCVQIMCQQIHCANPESLEFNINSKMENKWLKYFYFT